MKSKQAQALAYLRVSGKGQVDGGGFDRQRETIQQYAEAHGIEVVQEFRDEGVSGALDAADRPGLTAVIERIMSNGVRMILVERADRLARDLVVSEMLLAEFRKLGVQVVSCDSGTDLATDSGDPAKVLIRQVLGAVSEFEKSVIVRKLRAARQRKRNETGRCEGRKPFGHHPDEQRALKRIRQLNRKPKSTGRRSFGEIAKALNDEGFSTRYGKPWSRSTVHGIIKRMELPRD